MKNISLYLYVSVCVLRDQQNMQVKVHDKLHATIAIVTYFSLKIAPVSKKGSLQSKEKFTMQCTANNQ